MSRKQKRLFIWEFVLITSAIISMEKHLQTFRTILYAIIENEFLGPSFPYFCTLSVLAPKPAKGHQAYAPYPQCITLECDIVDTASEHATWARADAPIRLF